MTRSFGARTANAFIASKAARTYASGVGGRRVHGACAKHVGYRAQNLTEREKVFTDQGRRK